MHSAHYLFYRKDDKPEEVDKQNAADRGLRLCIKMVKDRLAELRQYQDDHQALIKTNTDTIVDEVDYFGEATQNDSLEKLTVISNNIEAVSVNKTRALGLGSHAAQAAQPLNTPTSKTKTNGKGSRDPEPIIFFSSSHSRLKLMLSV